MVLRTDLSDNTARIEPILFENICLCDNEEEEVCCIINSDKISNDNHPYVITFHENIYGQNGLFNKMRTVITKTIKTRLIERIFKMVAKKRAKNIKGSVFNYILCYYEDIILGHMVEYIKERDMTIKTLLYDGVNG